MSRYIKWTYIFYFGKYKKELLYLVGSAKRTDNNNEYLKFLSGLV